MKIAKKIKYVNSNTNNYCEITISIEKLFTDHTHYGIKYKYDFENKDYPVNIHPDNPFLNLNFKKFNFYTDNFKIVKNEFTDKMIEFLLLEDSELSQYTGTITPIQYKLSILISLQNFIDYY
jgi:hypothetical protein